ncbi:hypothetical protein TrST_g6140 [Triparma strigata]|uniref:Succinate-semialdehyde dehydrogenase, mitochondrial n=1 Tax=Triparma strigata TaxID=1606541 RepID=A0A9W7AV83_9STRA|nr:hypothetical protein TrST_g6140 [Triparma strigata]
MHRGGLLKSWASHIRQNKKDLATLMTYECGKPLPESLGEVEYGASFLDFYASECLRPNGLGGGTIIPTPFVKPPSVKNTRGTVMTYNEAVGVCGFITPWNFPLAMITRKVGPAIAAGCTSLVKPSELTPLTAMALEVLARRAGVPEGVFNVLTLGEEDTRRFGEVICTDDRVKKISFTGSTRVGKILLKQCAEGGIVKKASMELGGNAPFVVFSDADIDVAVKAAMASKFRNAGQTCVCSDRFLIHEDVEEEFLEKLVGEVKKIKVGDGMVAGVTMGPLISTKAREGVEEKVKEAVANGAEVLVGGERHEFGEQYYMPTVLKGVIKEDNIFKTETFGPVVASMTFSSDDEALDIIKSSSKTGLASYYCTQSADRMFNFSRRLEHGMVGVNEGIISSVVAPFGGVGESGIGREGNSSGMREYLEEKYVFVNHN